MTEQRDLPPETPDNFSGTPAIDPDAPPEIGDLPAEAPPNRVLVLVIGSAVVIALAVAALLFSFD